MVTSQLYIIIKIVNFKEDVTLVTPCHRCGQVRSPRGSDDLVTGQCQGPRGIQGQGGSDRKYDVFITTVKDKYKTEAERQSLDKTPPTEKIRGNNILHKT